MNLRYPIAAALSVLLALVAALSAAADQPPVRVSGAWIREAPPVVTTLGGYMTLENTSDEPLAIVGGSSPSFARVEIHRTEITGGVARMVRQDRVALPARGAVAFEPGSYHLMLMKPTQPLVQGDSATITLELEDGRSVAVVAAVRKGPPE